MACARACLDKKADGILILDMQKVSTFTDFFVICDGASTRQTKAIADNVLEKLSGRRQRAWHVEGYEEASWILLDYVDVIVHVFYKEIRDFYSLERLWQDAPRESVG